jgi:type IV pilus assembly protein PilQ
VILQSKGLGVRKNGNVLWIAPKDELAAKEQVDLEAKKKVADLEPTRTQRFQLNYTKADIVARGLTGQGQAGAGSGTTGTQANRILSSRGSVLFESRTNQLFVTDIPSKLEEVEALIAKIDIPVRQVLIEARIVEADDSFGRSLGVKLGGSDLRGVRGGTPGYSVGGGNNVTVGGNYAAIGTQTQQVAGAGAYTDTQFVNMAAQTLSNSTANPATFALSLFGAAANRFLNLEISALEAEGKGNVVSSPRVITADQTKARIEQGEEIPYQQATSSGATSVSFKKASLSLEVTPQITPEGNVILDLEVNKDSRGNLTAAGPAINTKQIKTQVLVENGGTVVIGGIFTQDEQTSVSKVPLLGDLPILGYLFQTRTKSISKTELLVFITPKIVADRSAAR